ADDEEGARRDAVQDADALVVDGGQPTPQTTVGRRDDRRGCDDHAAVQDGRGDYCHEAAWLSFISATSVPSEAKGLPSTAAKGSAAQNAATCHHTTDSLTSVIVNKQLAR